MQRRASTPPPQPRESGNAAGVIVSLGAIGAIVTMAFVLGQPRTAPASAAPAAPPVAEAPTASAPTPTLAQTAWRTPPTTDISGPALECAIYARQRSGVALMGAARTWWSGAQGRYERSAAPREGAVMVMGGTSAGHVAVVARIVSAREILIDHANWLGRGEIQTGALVRDVSPANDWTQVTVWHTPTNAMGLRAYPVMGFVGPGDAS